MTNDDPGYRLLHIAAFVAIFCLGVSAATIGPVLPFLAGDVDIALDTAGLLMTAFFIGSIGSSALVAFALHGRDTRVLCAVGLGAQLMGTLALGFAPTWPLVLASGLIIGIGDGFVVAGTHILIPATSDDVPSALNKLNIFFALGAIAGPVWAGAVLSTTGDREIVYAGICGLLLAALALMILADVSAHRAFAAPDEEFKPPSSATAWVMGGVLFLYVGAEFGLGTWVSTFARDTADAGVFGAALIAAGYWGALAAGRFVTAWYFRDGREPSLLLAGACAGGGIASLVLTFSSGNIALAAAAAFGAGFFFGPIWPTVTLGNAGGIAIPWLQGRVLVGAGATQGVGVTAVLCAVMFAIVTVFRARRPGARVVQVGDRLA
ncbi:MAG: MFS transporter [Chloroflexi bacterium]|nr:MFS transporter [Chloroflexota bacterium]